LFWNWISNGKIAWAANGNVFVFDGDVVSRLTNDDFSVNSGAYLDREMLVWRRTPPPPTVNNGQIFTGKLRPHGAFDALNTTGSIPLAVSFTNRSWEGVRTFLWDFGDGATSTDADPVHTYITSGNYTVMLTVNGPTSSVVERKYHLIRANSNTGLIERTNALPQQATLMQNNPNPFNPTTTIGYFLPKQTHVSLKIYNVLGQEMITLMNEVQEAGNRSIAWDATNNKGQTVGSGVYFYRIQTGDFVQTKKMLLLR
jgi:hypothetical protein